MNAAPARWEDRVGWVGRWLSEIYALDLEVAAERFAISLSEKRAQELLPAGCRSGVVVVEHADEIQIGLHLDPQDRDDAGTLVEETSHVVCIAWHAARDLPVSPLILELQAEVDRFVFGRLAAGSPVRDALGHFEEFRFADGLEPEVIDRYEMAHSRARAYCGGLARRFPRRSDTPAMLSELRRFYRASPETKLRAAA